jgi:subtilase family serine protease
VIQKISVFMLTVIAIVSGANIASHAQSQSVLTRHTRDAVINGQAPLLGHVSSPQTLDLVLHLPVRDQAGLDGFLKDVYDPSSSSFHKFLTVEEFTERFGPTVSDYETVKAFAKANGFQILSTSRNRAILRVRGSIGTVEKALHVSMNLYHDPIENRNFFAPDREPSVDLPFALWHVGGLDNYSVPKPMLVKKDASQSDVKSNATTGSGPSASFLGSDMRAAYYGGTTLTGAGQTLGLFELIGTDLTDLDTYYTNVGQTNTVPITLTSVDTQTTTCTDNSAGGFCDDTEQTLDMTQALGMAPGLAGLTMWIGTGGKSGQTVDDEGILNAMASSKPLNGTLSCSWAWKPTDNTTDDPIFQEFAAQGQNFFTASGDSGKWVSGGFVWPADDPYVVSVGGTDLDTASAGGPWASETAWVDGGGGISTNKFAIPSWQVAAAASCAKCSQTYRNGPDVSANANFSFYVCADQTKCTANDYGGTSFATPMWAAYVALANEQAASQGQASLGFINPALYDILAGSSYDTDFHDILTGGNSYGATVGYDLASGIGSPNGDNLINALVPPVSTASFSLSASPASISIAAGKSGQVAVTSKISGGFDAAVSLSASQSTFSPNPIPAPGSGKSKMTITVGKNVKAGNYTITITGTGGGVTETTKVKLTVTN